MAERVLLVDTGTILTLLDAQRKKGLNSLLSSGQRIVLTGEVLDETRRQNDRARVERFNEWVDANGRSIVTRDMGFTGTHAGERAMAQWALENRDRFEARLLSDDKTVYNKENSDRIRRSFANLGERGQYQPPYRGTGEFLKEMVQEGHLSPGDYAAIHGDIVRSRRWTGYTRADGTLINPAISEDYKAEYPSPAAARDLARTGSPARPTFYLIAGAGRPSAIGDARFGNAHDVDAATAVARLSPTDPTVTPDRETVQQRQDRLASSPPLIVDAPLSGSTLHLMERARQAGYQVELHYVGPGGARQAAGRGDGAEGGGGGRPRDAAGGALPDAITKADRATLYVTGGGERPGTVAALSRGAYSFAQAAPDWATRAAQQAAKLDHGRARTRAEMDRSFARATEAAAARGIDAATIRQMRENGLDGARPHDVPARPNRNRSDGHTL